MLNVPRAVRPGAAQVDGPIGCRDTHGAGAHHARECGQLLRGLSADAEHGQQGRHLRRGRRAVHELVHRGLGQRSRQHRAGRHELNRRCGRRAGARRVRCSWRPSVLPGRECTTPPSRETEAFIRGATLVRAEGSAHTLLARANDGPVRGSRGPFADAVHAGSHHPGSLERPLSRVLVPIEAMFSWSGILGARRAIGQPRRRTDRQIGADDEQHRHAAIDRGAQRGAAWRP